MMVHYIYIGTRGHDFKNNIVLISLHICYVLANNADPFCCDHLIFFLVMHLYTLSHFHKYSDFCKWYSDITLSVQLSIGRVVSAHFCMAFVVTVLPAKSDSGVMFCLQSYQGLRIDRSCVY